MLNYKAYLPKRKEREVSIPKVDIIESKTKDPPHFIEKTLLAAMESGGFKFKNNLQEDMGDLFGPMCQNSCHLPLVNLKIARQLALAGPLPEIQLLN